MTTSHSGIPYGNAYDRQAVRITGVVKTRPSIWRIGWGVCLGLLLFSLVVAAIAAAVAGIALALGANLSGAGIDISSSGPALTRIG